ncbi:KamA family radical SAM protein [uncultured Cardiobacterium sp.]|uniref:KamA family radical SAM protein n=1 Tax=uncultured Cardiobacterium sp. TaxID=417619 RepID=UPI002635F3A2|nr:KamA family radical SAM protein [uncultured Cardiobacterium sp.]
MTPEELARRRGLPPATLHRLLAEYQFALSDEMAAALGDAPDDPIAAQFFPDVRELTVAAGELGDPIGDAPHSPLPSLVHRYPNRVLWKISPVCAVYCRFCFRKEHIGRRGKALRRAEIDAVAAYLAAHPEVEEVIYSGGDPLMLGVKKLQQCAAAYRSLAHIRRLRIHSRIPVVQPTAINDALLAHLDGLPQSLHIVIHVNHSAELTANARAALRILRAHGALLYAQTVLLKGVNADADILARLMNDLLDAGVVPYYLHHPDLARGTGHFRTNLAEGKKIVRELRRRLSGIAMPTYIVEIPGGGGKVLVGELTVEQETALNKLGIR